MAEPKKDEEPVCWTRGVPYSESVAPKKKDEKDK